MVVRPLFLLLTVLAACSGGFATSDSRAGSQTAVLADGRVPAGTRLWLHLDEAVDDEAADGARFRARLAGHVLTPDGEVLLPRGARVLGRVVARGGGRAWLALESLEVAGARQRLHGQVVQALPPGRVGVASPVRHLAAHGLRADLPAGTRLEVRLSAPLLPLPEDEV
jgi:hypothetical protein